MASAAEDRSVKLYHVRSRTAAPPLPDQTAPVRWLAFAADGKTLVLGDGGRSVQLWDIPNRKLRATLQVASPVRCLTFSPDSKTLATGHADWTVVLWDGVTGQERSSLPGHTSPIHAVSFTRDNKTLISVDENGDVRDVGSGPRPLAGRASDGF